MKRLILALCLALTAISTVVAQNTPLYEKTRANAVRDKKPFIHFNGVPKIEGDWWSYHTAEANPALAPVTVSLPATGQTATLPGTATAVELSSTLDRLRLQPPVVDPVPPKPEPPKPAPPKPEPPKPAPPVVQPPVVQPPGGDVTVPPEDKDPFYQAPHRSGLKKPI